MTDNERETWAGLAGRIATGLPPAFLLLLLINTVFLGGVMWLIYAAQVVRAGTLNHIIDRCLPITTT